MENNESKILNNPFFKPWADAIINQIEQEKIKKN